MSHDAAKPLGWGLWTDSVFWFCLSGAIVVLGVCLGQSYVAASLHQDHFHTSHDTTLDARLTNWDGQWYLRIARIGYSYDPKQMSSVAFFPAFPLAGRYLSQITGLDGGIALIIVSNVCFFLALVVLRDYLRLRPNGVPELALYAPLVMAFFPVSFFFRMAYSESLLILLALLTFYGLSRRWPLLVVAAVVGLASAARPVGVALVPPLLLAIYRRYPAWGRRIAMLVAAAPLCVWGLGAYMGFQYAAFGNPFAFAQTQTHWRFRAEPTWTAKLNALATLEPLWSVYQESSPAYWHRHDRELGMAFSLQFANPLYFAGMAALVAYGAWRRWLSAEEMLFSAGIFLIPYLSKSYEGCMNSHARYALVAFPAYIVLGRLLTALPSHAAALLAFSGFLLGIYSALFANWFLFI